MARRDAQVQDDSRERQIAKLCGLRHEKYSRGRVTRPDAYDDTENPFELKSTTRNTVTTARDVGLHTLEGWRSRYWVVARGRNLQEGFEIMELYIAHPDDLEPFFGRIEERLKRDLGYCQEVLQAARAAGLDQEKVERVEYLTGRGITINNPKIPLSLVEQGGTRLDHKDPARAQRQIRHFVRRRPLNR